MKKISIIYHRIDFDGICSLAILQKFLVDGFSKIDTQVDTIGYNHGDAVPELDDYAFVYMADIALPPQLMKRLADEGRLVWIDHHKTAIDASVQFGYANVPGIREIGVGACELCWRFTHEGEPAPYAVQLLSCYDVFDKRRFDWENETLPFQYGLRAKVGLDPIAFSAFLYTSVDPHKSITMDMVSFGKMFLDSTRQRGSFGANAYGFDVSIGKEAVKALCVLTMEFGSIPYEKVALERNCAVVMNVNRIDADRYKVSCYSASGDAPISLGDYLLENYGGGGHHNAAGCVISKAAFIKLITEQTF